MSTGLFDILGPITVGPSSSHTTGAVRIGFVCRTLLSEEVLRSEITFYGSFAETYSGHGTDKAILGGLLGFTTSDERIRDSLRIASSRGMEYSFGTSDEPCGHPNTVVIKASGRHNSVTLTGVSLGGGVIKIVCIDGHVTEMQCRLDTTIIFNSDKAGVVAAVAGLLFERGYNISSLSLSRSAKEGEAMMIIETDIPVDGETLTELGSLPNVSRAVKIPKI